MNRPQSDPLLFNTILVIHDLNATTTKEDMEDHFNQFGSVKSVNMKPKPEKGACYTYIKFDKTSQALRAVDQMKGSRMPGMNKFTVLLADFNKAYLEMDVEFQEMLYTLFVTHPKASTAEDIREVYSKYGAISSVDVLKDKRTNRPRGSAFVKFNKQSEAALALEELNPPYKAKWAHVRALPPDQINEVRTRMHQEQFGMEAGSFGPEMGGLLDYNGGGGMYPEEIRGGRAGGISLYEDEMRAAAALVGPGGRMMGGSGRPIDREAMMQGYGMQGRLGMLDEVENVMPMQPGLKRGRVLMEEAEEFRYGNGVGDRMAMGVSPRSGGGALMAMRGEERFGERQMAGVGGGMAMRGEEWYGERPMAGVGGSMAMRGEERFAERPMGGAVGIRGGMDRFGPLEDVRDHVGARMDQPKSQQASALDAGSEENETRTAIEVLIPQTISLANLRRIFDMCPGLVSFDTQPDSRMAKLVYKSAALAAHAKEKGDGLEWNNEIIAVRYPPAKSIRERLQDTLLQLKSGNAMANFTNIVSSLEDVISTAVSTDKKPKQPIDHFGDTHAMMKPVARGIEKEMVQWCDVPMPYPKPMANPNTEPAAEVFLRAKAGVPLLPDEVLCKVLCRFGGLIKAFWVKTLDKREAFARFDNVESAQDCMDTLNGATVFNLPLRTMWSKNSKYHGEKRSADAAEESQNPKKAKFN